MYRKLVYIVMIEAATGISAPSSASVIANWHFKVFLTCYLQPISIAKY